MTVFHFEDFFLVFKPIPQQVKVKLTSMDLIGIFEMSTQMIRRKTYSCYEENSDLRNCKIRNQSIHLK